MWLVVEFFVLQCAFLYMHKKVVKRLHCCKCYFHCHFPHRLHEKTVNALSENCLLFSFADIPLCWVCFILLSCSHALEEKSRSQQQQEREQLE